MLGAAESFSIWDETHFWTSKHKIVHMTNSAVGVRDASLHIRQTTYIYTAAWTSCWEGPPSAKKKTSKSAQSAACALSQGFVVITV